MESLCYIYLTLSQAKSRKYYTRMAQQAKFPEPPPAYTSGVAPPGMMPGYAPMQAGPHVMVNPGQMQYVVGYQPALAYQPSPAPATSTK